MSILNKQNNRIWISVFSFFIALLTGVLVIQHSSYSVYAVTIEDGAKIGEIDESAFAEFGRWYGTQIAGGSGTMCDTSQNKNACSVFKVDGELPYTWNEKLHRIDFNFNGTTGSANTLSEAKSFLKSHANDTKKGESSVTNEYDEDGMLENAIIDAFTAKVTLFGTDIDFSNIGDSMAGFLSFDSMQSKSIDASGNSVNLYNIFKETVYPAAQGMGVSILTLMMMWKFIKEALEVERFSWQRVVMLVARACIVNMFIVNSFEMLSMLFQTVMDLMSHMSLGNIVTSAGASGLGQVFAAAISDTSNWVIKIVMFFTGLLMVFTWYGTATAVVVQVLTRYVKILVGMALSPIPIALAVDEQHGTDSMRYLLWMTGVFLQAPIIQVCIQIYNLLLSEYCSSLGDLSSIDFGTVIPLCIGVGLINGLLAAMISMAQQVTDKLIPA